MPTAHNRLRQLLLVLVMLNAACATRGPELTNSVAAIRTSVSNVDSESRKVFSDINKNGREDAIELLLQSGARPTEGAFAPVIDADTSARWSAALSGIQAYLAALEELVDSQRSTDITDNLAAIGGTFQGAGFGAKLPAGSVGLFSKLGGAIVAGAAKKEALAAMRLADPDFSALMTGLANLVGEPSGAGDLGTLRRILENHWVVRLTAIENAYGTLQNPSPDRRRKLLTDYGRALDQREAGRQRLVRLRQALLAVGEAHSAAAKGNSGGTLYWLGQLNDALKAARDEAAKED